MSVASMAFLYLAVAASGGALAFLFAQRMSGRTPPEVAGCYEGASQLESATRDLGSLCSEAKAVPTGAHGLLESARAELEEAVRGLHRGADRAV